MSAAGFADIAVVRTSSGGHQTADVADYRPCRQETLNIRQATFLTLKDTLGSLVYPPASSTEGWYFFSITALLIIAVYLLCRQNPTVGKDKPETMPVDKQLMGQAVLCRLDWDNQLYKLWKEFVSVHSALALYARFFEFAGMGTIEYHPCAHNCLAAVDSIFAFCRDAQEQCERRRYVGVAVETGYCYGCLCGCARRAALSAI